MEVQVCVVCIVAWELALEKRSLFCVCLIRVAAVQLVPAAMCEQPHSET